MLIMMMTWDDLIVLIRSVGTLMGDFTDFELVSEGGVGPRETGTPVDEVVSSASAVRFEFAEGGRHHPEMALRTTQKAVVDMARRLEGTGDGC